MKNFLQKGLLCFFLMGVMCPTAAQAVNDPDPHDPCPAINCASNANQNTDNRYTNLQLKGEQHWVDNTHPFNATGNESVDPGLSGSMPDTSTTQMPKKDTPAMSLIANAPWLWKDVDFSIRAQVYNGMGAQTINNALNTADNVNTDYLFFNKTDQNIDPNSVNANLINTQQINANKISCQVLKLNTCSHDPDTYELWKRLDDDSCANQMILPSALQSSIFSSQFRNYQQPWNESMCQPLKLSPQKCVQDLINGGCKKDLGSSDGNLYDYRAWGYLERAWNDVLSDNEYELVDSKVAGHANHAPVTAGQGEIVGPNLGNTGQKALGQPFNVGAIGASPGDSEYASPGYGTGYTVTNNYGIGYGQSGGTQGSGKLLSLADIAKIPFERIIDPTHPFSPRWDFNGHDRDYSTKQVPLNSATPTVPATLTPQPPIPFAVPPVPPATVQVNPAKAILSIEEIATGIGGLGYDAVPPGAPTQCVVRCAALPVDIMSFRSQEFDACMSARIGLNQQCFWAQVEWLETDLSFYSDQIFPICDPGQAFPPPQAVAATINDSVSQNDCHWVIAQMFGLQSQLMCKSYFATQSPPRWPVCSTKYDFPADGDNPDYCKPARDLIGDPSNAAGGVKKCCNDLAQALTPINTLKIRNTKLTPTLIPVPAGYSYNGFFPGTSDSSIVTPAETSKYSTGLVPELPFMRWWDTGTSAGGNNNDSTRNYDPNCDLGYYDTIVGVGDETHSCKYGGVGNSNVSYADCVTIPALDPLTSWEELKYYQLQSIRKYGLNCLPQYEKQWKFMDAEDGALLITGGDPHFAASMPGTGNNNYQLQKGDWSLAWRGYLTAAKIADRFPCFGSTSSCSDPSDSGAIGGGYTGPGNITGGLSKALPGDIIYLYQEDMQALCTYAPPYVGVVKSINPDSSGVNSSIVVIEMNNGKHPDACGVTNFAGNGQERTIYQSCIPAQEANLYSTGTQDVCGYTTTGNGNPNPPAVNSFGSCSDPLAAVCTFNNANSLPPPPTYNSCTPTVTGVWNNFRIYRPCADVRNGGSGSNCP